MSFLDRRTFIVSSFVASAGAFINRRGHRSLKSISRNPPSERIRMACVGCGGMGRGDLVEFLKNDEVDCVVICDVDDEQLKKASELVFQLRGIRPSIEKDFRRIFDRKDVDILLVATPDHWHALPTIYACECGLDVYVEKPLARTIEEGRAIYQAVKNNQSVVQMGTQWRSAEHVQDAVRFIQSGRLGKIRLIRVWAYLDWVGGIGNPPDSDPPPGVDYEMWLGPAPKRPFNPNRFHFNFRWFWDYAGGLMTDWGGHLLNVALWAMNFPIPCRVTSSGGKWVANDNAETPDTQVTLYEFSDFVLIFEHQMLGGLGPGNKPHGMLFNGSEGTVLIDTNGWEIISEPKKTTLESVKYPALSDGRAHHIKNFLDCVKTRKQPVENVEVGSYVSAMAHLGNIAFRTGSAVLWDNKRGCVIGSSQAKMLEKAQYRKPWTLPRIS